VSLVNHILVVKGIYPGSVGSDTGEESFTAAGESIVAPIDAAALEILSPTVAPGKSSRLRPASQDDTVLFGPTAVDLKQSLIMNVNPVDSGLCLRGDKSSARESRFKCLHGNECTPIETLVYTSKCQSRF